MVTQGPSHSKLAYPSILANQLNCDYINLGKSGNSNKEIWYDVMNFDFQPDDIAVITWTYFSRFCIIKSESIRRINPWKKEEKLYYMNYSNRHDMILDFYVRLNHVNLHLTKIGIKNYNFLVEELVDEVPRWNTTPVLGTFNKIDEAADNCHPGVISHSEFSKDIYKEITKIL